METQLFFDLTGSSLYIHFCEANELGSISENLKAHGVALFEIDGTTIRDREDLFKAFAVALKMPKGWCGNEGTRRTPMLSLSISMTFMNGFPLKDTSFFCEGQSGSGHSEDV